MNKIDAKINVKIDGFQKTVLGLTESIKTVETKVSENETKLLAVKDKVTQHEKKFCNMRIKF